MATGKLSRHTHVAAQVNSAGRRHSFGETATEDSPLPTSISKVLGKLKKAGIAERKIVQLEKSERILQSLRFEHPRSSRLQHTTRPRQSPNKTTGSKPTSEPCVKWCENEEVEEPITLLNSECQSDDEFEPPCTSIADSALTKSVRLLEELKLFDLSEDEGGRPRAESFDPGAAMQASPSCTPRDAAESVAVIKERIDLLIELLQQPGQQTLSSQREAVIDELRSAIHEHTRQRGKCIDGVPSCEGQMQFCDSSPASASAPSGASPGSTLTRTPSDVSFAHWSDHSPVMSPGCSTVLESPYLGSPASTLRAALLEDKLNASPASTLRGALFEDKLNATQGRGAVSQSLLVQSLLLPHPERPPAAPISQSPFPQRASCPPPALKASSRTLKTNTSANSTTSFSPRRLVCTNVKITRTWKYE